VTGRNFDLSPAFGWNLRFTFSLLSSPTSKKVFQSTRKYRPFFRLVGKAGFGALVVPPKDSSKARRFVPEVVDDVGVNAANKSEPSFAESEPSFAESEAVVVAVVVEVSEEVVVGEASTDSATRSLVSLAARSRFSSWQSRDQRESVFTC